MFKFIRKFIFGEEETFPSAIYNSTDIRSAKESLKKQKQVGKSFPSSNSSPTQEDSMSGFATGYLLNMPIGGPGALLGDIARDGCIGSCRPSHDSSSFSSHDSGSSHCDSSSNSFDSSSSSCDSGSSFDSGSCGSDGGGSSGGDF